MQVTDFLAKQHPAGLAPWRHQAEEFERYRDAPHRGLLWGMRTGKSRAIIDLACYLHQMGEIAGVIVVAPNGVHRNWIRREVPKHSWRSMPPPQVHAWSSLNAGKLDFRRDVADMLERGPRLKWLAVNGEALGIPGARNYIKAFLRTCKDRVLFIADESHAFRRPGAKRTGKARSLAKRCPYRRIATGTALLNSPLHAFSQFELIQPGALGHRTFETFKPRYALYENVRTFNRTTQTYGREYPKLVEYRNMEELRERMSKWVSVVLREDCDDMPELLEIERPICMSPAQAAAYLQLVKEYMLEIDEEEIEATDGGVRVMKLQQIVSGFIIDGLGETHSIDDEPPLLQAMLEEVEATLPGKTIVWCRFREDIRRVCKLLHHKGIRHVEYHGGVKQRDRDRNEDSFRDDPDIKVLVGQPQSGGQGLDFSAAEHVLWYSALPDTIMTHQANERATQVGGRRVTLTRLTTPGTVTDGIEWLLKENASLADVVSGRGLRDLLANTRVE